ncbi:hypothetical protein ACUN8C_06825 [Kushneria sp. Sum13]|uniref:hypothetical protein n=1 Tax=Kushneria sp. Sum13 TaxID=3459196 RepID=UPI0040453CB5
MSFSSETSAIQQGSWYRQEISPDNTAASIALSDLRRISCRGAVPATMVEMIALTKPA